MPSRSCGKKSRHGCERCKQRHVKCDEAIPCKHCIRRNEHCTLIDTRATAVYPFRDGAHHTPLQTLTPTSPYPTTYRSTPSNPPSWALDLHLMSHFVTRTVYTFSSYSTLVNAWQTTIVRDAVAHPFLLHGILAMSALHLASRPRYPEDDGDDYSQEDKGDGKIAQQDYVRAFRHHQSEAIPHYRRILTNLDVGDEEFEARSSEPWPAGPVFAMAVLTGITAAAGISDNSLSLDPTEGEDHQDESTPAASLTPESSSKSNRESPAWLDATFDRLLSIFVAIRGIRAIVRAAQQEDIFRGTVYQHLSGPYLQTNHLPNVPLPASFTQWYDTLRGECLDELAPIAEEHAVCARAISELQEVHDGAERLLELKRERLGHHAPHQRHSAGGGSKLRGDIGWFIKWTAIVTQEYLALVRAGHPGALAVMAQFAAVCGLAEDEWYMENWVKNAIAAIRHVMGRGEGSRWVDRIVERWADKEGGPTLT